MRRRQLQATLVVAFVAILTLGVPLAYFVTRQASNAAQKGLAREANSIAAFVEDRIEAGSPLRQKDVNRFAPKNRRVEVDPGDGTVLRAGSDVGSHPYAVTQPIGTDGSVRIARATDSVRAGQLRNIGLVAAAALIAAAVAVALAVRSARRLSVPLQRLAEHAERLGGGDFRLSDNRYDIPELDAVAVVLDTTTLRVADLVQRERRLVGDISHQLRSGLTALSLRLEEIASRSPDELAREEAAVALDQTERLSGVIDELLAQAHQDRAGAAVTLDVAEQIAAVCREFEPALVADGRQIVVQAPQTLPASATPGRLRQALDVLVDNARRHGAGTVTVRARVAGKHVLIEVQDEGAGITPDLAGRIFDRGVSGGTGTGLGLGLARSLLDADGGRLELRSADPTVFGVFLPRATTPSL